MVKAETPTINRYMKNIVPDNFQRTGEVEISGLAPCNLEGDKKGSSGTTDTPREDFLNIIPGVGSAGFT